MRASSQDSGASFVQESSPFCGSVHSACRQRWSSSLAQSVTWSYPSDSAGASHLPWLWLWIHRPQTLLVSSLHWLEHNLGPLLSEIGLWKPWLRWYQRYARLYSIGLAALLSKLHNPSLACLDCAWSSPSSVFCSSQTMPEEYFRSSSHPSDSSTHFIGSHIWCHQRLHHLRFYRGTCASSHRSAHIQEVGYYLGANFGAPKCFYVCLAPSELCGRISCY